MDWQIALGSLSSTLASDGVASLTWFSLVDVSTMVDGDGDPEHRLRFDVPPDFVPSAQHAEAVIRRWEVERRAGTRFTFAVREAATGAVVGGCELQPRASGAANLSYWTYPAFRRRGFATRALALLSNLAFDQCSLTALEIVTDPDNRASRAVALRNGFTAAGSRGAQDVYRRGERDGPGR